jgi:hypothetical protein
LDPPRRDAGRDDAAYPCASERLRLCRMSSSGMSRRLALVRTEVSEVHVANRYVLQLLVTANFVPSSLIIFTLMMEKIHSPEKSVLTRATQRYIPEGCILHTHRRENLKSYRALTGWAL